MSATRSHKGITHSARFVIIVAVKTIVVSRAKLTGIISVEFIKVSNLEQQNVIFVLLFDSLILRHEPRSSVQSRTGTATSGEVKGAWLPPNSSRVTLS